MTGSVAPAPTWRHEALLYRGIQGFLAATLPPVRASLAQGAPVMVAVPRERGRALGDALGPDRSGVVFVDMEELGRNPGRIIPAWRTFVGTWSGSGPAPLGIGEPRWPGRTAEELEEAARHEALLGRAFGESPAWTLLCPYDAEGLAPDVRAAMERTHPLVVRDGARAPSRAFAPPTAEALLDGSLTEPGGSVEAFAFGPGDLGHVRVRVGRHAAGCGVAPVGSAHLAWAAAELAGNSVTHGGGGGMVRLWEEAGSALCEVSDRGLIRDPLAGRSAPLSGTPGPRGLWYVHQLCDLVELRSGPERTVVRVRVRTGGGPTAADLAGADRLLALHDAARYAGGTPWPTARGIRVSLRARRLLASLEQLLPPP